MNLKKIAAAAALAVGSIGSAYAAPVGLELLLLVDVSGSVSDAEYALQKGGYVAAFQSAAVQAAIAGAQLGSIAVKYVEWSGRNQQATAQTNWTLINDAASANAFAATLNGLTRAFNGSTAVQDAIGKTFSLFGTEVGGAANGFESLRQVIDVSGDGDDNDSATFSALGAGRAAALLAGVDTINGLTIGTGSNVVSYYNQYVVSAGGFVRNASGFDTFAAAVEDKLVTEIRGIPEPGTLALVGLAIAGLGFGARRRG